MADEPAADKGSWAAFAAYFEQTNGFAPTEGDKYDEAMFRFFAAGAAREREACAQMVEDSPIIHRESRRHPGELVPDGVAMRAAIASAIRARSEKGEVEGI
jgi:hypothetical protein